MNHPTPSVLRTSALAGLWSTAALGVLLALAPAASAQTLSENFNDNVADNWVPVSPATGWAIISANGSLVYTQAAFDGLFPRSVYTGATWTKGYILTGRVRMSGTGTGNFVGLIYHYIDPTHYHAVLLNKAGGNYTAQIWRNNGSTNPSLVATGPFATPPSTDNFWVTLEIERGHDDITTVKVNGVIVTELTRSQALTGNAQVGVIDQAANAQWDDITVVTTEPPEDPEEPVPTPEMSVSGNGAVIPDDNNTPTPEDHTDFGSVVAGEYVDRTFTLTNSNAEYPLTLGSVILTGDFSVVTAAPATLAPGASANIVVRFTPTVFRDQIGMLSIANNDPLRHPYNFALRGTGTRPAGLALAIHGNADAEEYASSLILSGDTTPSIVDHTDFGSEFVNGSQTVRTYSVHNLTGSEQTVGPVTVSGSSDFVVIAQPSTIVPVASNDRIHADGRTYFSILFNPSSAGVKTATVTLPHAGGTPQTFVIQGNGVEGTSIAKAEFPRIGGIFYRNNANSYGSSYNDPIYQQTMAKYDLGVLTLWTQWGGSFETMNAPVNAVKALNPDILLGNYVILESTYDNASNLAFALNSGTGPTGNGGTWQPNDWWARDQDGAQGTNSGYPSQKLTNVTHFITPNAAGDRYPQVAGRVMASEMLNPLAQLDMVFTDNTFYRPRSNMDWDRNDLNDDADATTVQTNLRRGIADFLDQLRVSAPGLMIMPNYDGQPSFRRGYGRDIEYQRKAEGALGESLMGSAGSPEGYSGWYNMMTGYRSLMDNTLAPHLVLIGVRSTQDGRAWRRPQDYVNGAPFAFARYSIASVLMDDGYIEFHGADYAELIPPWFDEFDLAGTATTSWLGRDVDPPQRAPKQNGVFARRFENGLAIVNPRTESFLANSATVLRSAQTIDLAALYPGQYYRRIAGVQDPVVNNGQLVTAPITIEPGDGLILEHYVDTTPPTIVSITPSRRELWAPNLSMVNISLTVQVTDDTTPAPATEIISVSSDEAIGDIAPDWVITGALTLQLRSERNGTGDGRIYTITVRSTDDSGNSSTATATVLVPHNQ